MQELEPVGSVGALNIYPGTDREELYDKECQTEGLYVPPPAASADAEVSVLFFSLLLRAGLEICISVM